MASPASSRSARRGGSSSNNNNNSSDQPRREGNGLPGGVALHHCLLLLVALAWVLLSFGFMSYELRVLHDPDANGDSFTTTVSASRRQYMRVPTQDGRFTEEQQQQQPLHPAAVVSAQDATVVGQPRHQTVDNLASTDTCSPLSVDPRTISYHSSHRFYDALQSSAPAVPVMRGAHQFLCDRSNSLHLDLGWSYCLPMTTRDDPSFCAGPDRMDLLTAQSSPRSVCTASVLHMLLVDVFDELKALGGKPALLFGSLLGAMRSHSIIPFTEDADLGYQVSEALSLVALQDALWKKGYHLFRQDILRVCVAPTHPLAGYLYDPEMVPTKSTCNVPYLDIYKMEQDWYDDEWHVETIRHRRLIPAAQFEPYTTVDVNGLQFDTLADPLDFVRHEYGPDWRTPIRRRTHTVTKAPDPAPSPSPNPSPNPDPDPDQGQGVDGYDNDDDEHEDMRWMEPQLAPRIVAAPPRPPRPELESDPALKLPEMELPDGNDPDDDTELVDGLAMGANEMMEGLEDVNAHGGGWERGVTDQDVEDPYGDEPFGVDRDGEDPDERGPDEDGQERDDEGEAGEEEEEEEEEEEKDGGGFGPGVLMEDLSLDARLVDDTADGD